MKLNFKNWLKENATTTADVANFALPISNIHSRINPLTLKKKKSKGEKCRLM